MPANELFSPAEIGAVAGFPVKSVYKVIEQRSPNGLVIRRNGQALRGTGGRGGNQTLTNFINSGSPRLLQPTARATTILVALVLQPQVPLSAVHMPCLAEALEAVALLHELMAAGRMASQHQRLAQGCRF